MYVALRHLYESEMGPGGLDELQARVKATLADIDRAAVLRPKSGTGSRWIGAPPVQPFAISECLTQSEMVALGLVSKSWLAWRNEGDKDDKAVIAHVTAPTAETLFRMLDSVQRGAVRSIQLGAADPDFDTPKSAMKDDQSLLRHSVLPSVVAAIPPSVDELRLFLPSNLVAPNRGSEVARTLQRAFLPGLRHLDLSLARNPHLGEAGMSVLVSRPLSVSLRFLRLNFTKCNIGQEGCRALGAAVPTGIRRLVLIAAQNTFGDAGVKEIVNSIPVSAETLVLDFSYCNVSAAGCGAINAALKREGRLGLQSLTLRLKHNWLIGNGGVEKLVKEGERGGWLPPSVRQLSLDLGGCQLQVKDFKALVASLPPWLQGLKLHLGFNRVCNRGLTALFAKIPQSLTDLVLSVTENVYCPGITDEGLRAIAAALPSCIRTCCVALGKDAKVSDRAILAFENARPGFSVIKMTKLEDFRRQLRDRKKGTPTGLLEIFDLSLSI